MPANPGMERARELVQSTRPLSPGKRTCEPDTRNGYSPFSRPEYRKRLFTFVDSALVGINTLAPVHLALHGFASSARSGFIECVTCAASLSATAAASITDRMEPYIGYSALHSGSCQWRVMPCAAAIQYFDCSEDVQETFAGSMERWGRVVADEGLRRQLSVAGWRPLTKDVGECVYGCGRCVVQDGGAYELQHYYYCPWRWDGPSEPSGCTIMKLKIK